MFLHTVQTQTSDTPVPAPLVKPSPPVAPARIPNRETPSTLWDDTARIQQDGAEAALVGLPVADLLKNYTDLFERARQFEEERFEVLSGPIDAEAKRLAGEMATLEAARETLAQRRDELRALLPPLAATTAEQAAGVEGLLHHIQAQVPATQRQRQREEDAHRRDRDLEEIHHRRTLAEQRAAAAADDQAQNRDQLARAADRHRKDLDDTAALLAEVRARSHHLQQRGLTRPVARFLNWASFFSLAGVGVVLAQLFAARLAEPNANPAWVLRLQHGLGGSADATLAGMFSQYALLLATMATFLGAFIVGTLMLLSQLDPDRSGLGRRATSRRSTTSGNRRWATFVDLTPSTIARRLQAVDRSALLRLLAAVPVVVAVALVAFAWIASAGPTVPRLETGPSAGLIYIGILHALLTASAGLLFWLFVLRPASDGETLRGTVSTYYGMVFALPVVALITMAILPARANSLAIASLGVSLVVATSGLGHGLYLGGIFSREDHLEGRIDRLREALEATTKQPTAEDYMEESPVPIPDAASPIGAARRGLLASRTWRPFATRRRPLESTPEPSEVLIDYADVPADLLQRLNEARALHRVSQTRLSAFQEERQAVAGQLDAHEVAMAADRAALAGVERHRIEIFDEHRRAMLDLLNGYRRASVTIERAYNMSRFARKGR